jgi:hypothetical protein
MEYWLRDSRRSTFTFRVFALNYPCDSLETTYKVTDAHLVEYPAFKCLISLILTILVVQQYFLMGVLCYRSLAMSVVRLCWFLSISERISVTSTMWRTIYHIMKHENRFHIPENVYE